MNWISVKDRLLNRSIIRDNGCVEWTGAVKGMGYGYLTIGSRTDGTRRTILAHRLSYQIYKGDPDKMCVLHACDNPRCIEPEHLFLGTRADNNKDRESKNRGIFFKGEDNPRAKLTFKQAEEIREKYRSGKYTHRQLAGEYGFKDHKPIREIIIGKSYQPPKD